MRKGDKRLDHRMTARWPQILLIFSTLAFSWLAFQAVHEFGHVLHLWLSGGTVEYVVLHPLRLSYTHAGANPDRLFVVIGGPLWGCVLPLALWGVAKLAVPSRAYLARFFAGTCLVANGVYLAADALMQGGDGRELALCGVPVGVTVAVGVVCFIAGLFLWNGQGPRFGIGAEAQDVRRSDAVIMAGLLAVVVVTEVLLSPLPS